MADVVFGFPLEAQQGSGFPVLLTPQQVARAFAVSPSKLAKLRMTGEGPPFVKDGRSVRYPAASTAAHYAARLRRSTSEAAQ
jgi:hypothetical protein